VAILKSVEKRELCQKSHTYHFVEVSFKRTSSKIFSKILLYFLFDFFYLFRTS